MAHRRPLRRSEGKRRCRRMFVIATEGAQTEPRYFAMFNSEQATIHVKVLKGSRQSDPYHVLKRLLRYLQEEGLRKNDEDTPQCLDWPRSFGSTVYRLVEKLTRS